MYSLDGYVVEAIYEEEDEKKEGEDGDNGVDGIAGALLAPVCVGWAWLPFVFFHGVVLVCRTLVLCDVGKKCDPDSSAGYEQEEG